MASTRDYVLNFNHLAILLLFFLSACGVKSKPTYPKSMKLPSYIEKFAPKSQQDDEETDKE